MKTQQITFLAFFILLFYPACQKDTEINNEYIEYKVHVQKFIDKQNVPNYDLCLFQRLWGFRLQSYVDSILMISRTDYKGDALFKVKKDLIKNQDIIFYYVSSYFSESDTIPDSTSEKWKSFGSCEL